eukprot:Sspe_Gene.6418::Locus_2168_Transcript_1_1_Confidence_1.000_Length_4050::g.6418::m.6418/K11492/NCAPG2, LUZP5; condensin-2 complex subunit G2
MTEVMDLDEPQPPRTPTALKTRGLAWLHDIQPAQFVSSCPAEKRPQLWLKVAEAAAKLFGKDSALLQSSANPEALETQAIAVCGLLKHFPETGVTRSDSVTSAAVLLHDALLQLYDFPSIQHAVADALAALVEHEAIEADKVIQNLLMWCVWACTLTEVTAADVRRLHSIKHCFACIAWRDARAKEFVGFVQDLVTPAFLELELSEGIMLAFFQQDTNVVRALHRRFCIQIVRAGKESARFSLLRCLCSVWSKLDGFHLAVFEQEVVRPYIQATIKADLRMFAIFREILQRFRTVCGISDDKGKRRVRCGLNRILRESELMAGIDAPNAVLRKNCVALLGDHFPVAGEMGGKAEMERTQIDQLQMVLRALRDPSSVVRANAVAAACRIFRTHWDQLPKASTLPCLDLIFTKLAYDKTDGTVRLTCLRAFKTELLQQPMLHEFLRKLFPKLRHLDDGNAKVRQAYVALLSDISRMKFVPLNEVVPEESIIRRIGVEKHHLVLDGLCKLARKTVWVEQATKDVVTHENIGTYVKRLLVVATKYPAAAINLYASLAKTPKDHPMTYAHLIAGVIKWMMAAKTNKSSSQIGYVLATVQAMLQSLTPKLASQKGVRERLSSVFTDDVTSYIRETFDTPVIKQLLLHVQTYLRLSGVVPEDAQALVETVRNSTITQQQGEWKLHLRRCVHEGALNEVLSLAVSWLSSDDCDERRKGAVVITELLYEPKVRVNVPSNPRWRDAAKTIMNNLSKAAQLLRSTIHRKEDPEYSAVIGREMETLGHITIHLAARSVACNLEQDMNDENNTEAPKKAKKRGVEAAQRGSSDEVMEYIRFLTDTLLPACTKGKRSGQELLGIMCAEQVVIFLTQAVSCGLLTPRDDDSSQEASGQYGGALRAVLTVDAHLLPRVLDCINRMIEMQVAGKLLSDEGGGVVLATRLIRTAASACDDEKTIEKGSDLTAGEELRDKAWAHLIEQGVHPRHVGTLASTLYRYGTPDECRELVDSLWVDVLDRAGCSVLPFVLAEVCFRFREYVNIVLENLANILMRGAASGPGLGPQQVATVAVMFVALLACRSRPLTTRLAGFKETRLDPFFEAHRLSEEHPGAEDALKEAMKPVDDDDDDDNEGDPGLLGHCRTGGKALKDLASILNSLDWSPPVNGRSASRSMSRGVSRSQSRAEGLRAVSLPLPSQNDEPEHRRVERVIVDDDNDDDDDAAETETVISNASTSSKKKATRTMRQKIKDLLSPSDSEDDLGGRSTVVTAAARLDATMEDTTRKDSVGSDGADELHAEREASEEAAEPPAKKSRRAGGATKAAPKKASKKASKAGNTDEQ